MSVERTRTTSINRTRAATLGTLLIIFFLGLGLRLYQLDTDSLWLDEIKAATTSRMEFVSMLNLQADESTHPPLLYILNRFFISFMGDSDFVFRLQAALFGSLSLLLTYKLGRMLWSVEEGLIGTFLLAISAYHIRYSQEARHYALMVFLGLLSLIFLLKALQSGRKRMWILFGLCAGLNTYTHYFAFLILGSETLFASGVLFHGWLTSKRRQDRTNHRQAPAPGSGQPPPVSPDKLPPARSTVTAPSDRPSARKQALSLAAVLATLAVCYLPWLPFMYRQIIGRTVEFEGLGGGGVPGAELSLAFLDAQLHAFTQVSGVLALLFVALFALGLARSRAQYIALFGLWILPPFVFPFVVRTSHFFSSRYAVYIVPIICLGMARGIAVLTGWLTRHLPWFKDRQGRRLALASALTVATFGIISLSPIRDYYGREKTDYRGVADHLAQTLHPGDVIVTDGDTFRAVRDADLTERCLSYYMDLRHQDETPILLVQKGFWANLQEVGEPHGQISAVLARRYRPAAWDREPDVVVVDFENLSVIHLRQPAGDLSQDALFMLEGLTRLLRLPDAQFDVRVALAEAYASLGMDADAGSQIVLARTVMPDDERAIVDLAAVRAQLQPSVDVQLAGITLGEALSLPGYAVRPASLKAGETVSVTLWWQTRVRMDRDYTAFVHILRPEGQVLAQEDRLLQSGVRPTSKWRINELARDEYELSLPADAEPGQYYVAAGVYFWETGERLAAWDAEGQRIPNDTIILGSITVDLDG